MQAVHVVEKRKDERPRVPKWTDCRNANVAATDVKCSFSKIQKKNVTFFQVLEIPVALLG